MEYRILYDTATDFFKEKAEREGWQETDMRSQTEAPPQAAEN